MAVVVWFAGPTLPRDVAFLLVALVLVAVARRRAYGPPRWRLAADWRRDCLWWLAGLVVVTCAAMARAAYLGVPVAPDAEGYEDAARVLWERAAQSDVNPIAFTYVRSHPAAREPLFIALLQAAFAVFGAERMTMRLVTLGASLTVISLTMLLGALTLGRTAGLIAGACLSALSWHVIMAGQGLREDVVLVFLLTLACVVAANPRSDFVAPLAAGSVGAAAILTRLDAAGGVMALLGLWWLRVPRSTGRVALAAVCCAALVAPMLVGNALQRGAVFTQMGDSMGGDIREVISPLVRLEYPLGTVLALIAAGLWQMIVRDVFFQVAELPPRLQPYLGGVLLASFAATAFVHARRGRLELGALALLGGILPPFAFIAGTAVSGLGGGYVPRYTYLCLVPALLLAADGLARVPPWCAQAARAAAVRR